MNNSVQTADSEFGPIRSALWPIHGFEMKKFLPMSFLMFFILLVYRMARDLKDVLIRKLAICGGTELIPQLKLWFVMPATFLIVMLYAVLINKFGFKRTFYTMISIYASFYLIFMLFLYPNFEVIHASEATVRAMQASWPPFFYWIIPCLTNWSFTMFYVLADIWGTLAISSLFWQFAYKVTMQNEVKRFFALYPIIGSTGVICSGWFLKILSHLPGDTYIKICVAVCVFSCFVILALFFYVNNIVLKDPRLYNAENVTEKKKKEKVGMLDGIKILCKSPYLLMICALVLCYGISTNFFEIVWKKYMDVTIKSGNGISEMMANLSILTGVITIVSSFVGQNIFRKTSWKRAALVPVVALMIFGGFFFGIVLYGKYVSPTIFGVHFATIAVWFGVFQDAFSKSVKYCFFDSTKNMAYLPLDEETKTKGQAAVELIGGRSGKAGASAVNTFLTSVVSPGSTIINHVVTIVVLFTLALGVWFGSVLNLSKKYEAKVAEKNA